ncbi:trypsin-1-like [Arctopsyche grandis]|uniref:trypsin-1-like n=1 Tax=Arctopsyche grandis TaxID=121162 RepID=UPI00406DA460
MKILPTVTTVFILFVQTKSQTSVGDDCFLNNGTPGVCKIFKTCLKAKNQLRFEKINPTICSYIGFQTVVCCPGDGPPPTTTTTTTTRKPFIPSKFIECEYPKDAIKVRKTGQKAWDKCIDLADSVFPCAPLSLIIGAHKIRTDTCKHTAKELIFGGTDAKQDEFPHQAVLGYDNTENNKIDWDCGGTLISEQWVMTAGHCLYNKYTRVGVKYVRLGGEDMNIEPKPEFFFNITRRVKHPDYVRKWTYNDIALVKLDRSLKYGTRMRPACLHIGNEVNDGKAIATGWGATEDRRTRSNNLLKVTIDKFPYEECRDKHPSTRKSPDGIRNQTQICYGSKVAVKDTCQGDSGGPLQIYNNGVHCTYTIIGITSVGKYCGSIGTPAIYTRVSAFVPWIESVVWP